MSFRYSVTESGRLLRMDTESPVFEEFSDGRWGEIVRSLPGKEFLDAKVVSEEEARSYMEKSGKPN